MQQLTPVVTRESPREIIARHCNIELPIRGGWGYSQADACVIDKNDPVVNQGIPFNGVGIEYIFVEKRIYEEMIIFRAKGEQFSGIKWKLRMQSLKGGYDKLEFNITAFPAKDWDALKAEWEGPSGISSPTFDQSAHQRKREHCMISITREFWFEITSFFEKNHS